MDANEPNYTSNTNSTHVASYRYASDAIQEVRDLLTSTAHSSSAKLVSQSVPKHMRRRAVSHHPKRLPRKYRSAHAGQMKKSGNPVIRKRPSRFYRRRPANLLSDYVRRQRKEMWLETHIWHARRFHMVNRWGYRLAYSSTAKTRRYAYRSTTEHCLLQDISFMVCVQLEGPMHLLGDGFARITSTKCGFSIMAKTYANGCREGSIELFGVDKYPKGALGTVKYLWCGNPVTSPHEPRMLWVWIHPSCYVIILEEIIKAFKLRSERLKIYSCNFKDTNEQNKPELPKAPTKREKQMMFTTRGAVNKCFATYSNVDDTVKLTELKNSMNRFRLTGPLAEAVLTKAFKTKDFKPPGAEGETLPTDWFQTLLQQSEAFHKIHSRQSAYWKVCGKVRTPTEHMSNMVVGLNIVDPRVHRPRVRTKALPEDRSITDESMEILYTLSQQLHCSKLWDAKVRADVVRNRLTTQEYNELRAKHAIVPGGDSAFEDALQTVPVILIQQHGGSTIYSGGYGCGWDVIAPAGYGMHIWLSLIAWGARPGGLREFEMMAHEAGKDEYPPDTITGKQLNGERYVQNYTRYFCMPPNKRCNYRKLGVVSPFRAPYEELVRDWLPADVDASEAGFYVLRDRELLSLLETCFRKNNPIEHHHSILSRIAPNALIPIRFKLRHRGNVPSESIISLIKKKDLACFRINPKGNRQMLYEKMFHDFNEKMRKVLRLKHKRQLKLMRAKRVRRKRKLQEKSEVRVKIEPANTASMVEEHRKEMCNLWVPNVKAMPVNSVRKQSSRDTIGYVSSGGYSFGEAVACGVGYVTNGGLRELLTLNYQYTFSRPICLIRKPSSCFYSVAEIFLNRRDE